MDISKNPFSGGDDIINIYYDDLTEKAQKELLKFYNIKDPKEANWDNNEIPVTGMPMPEIK